MGYGDRGQSRQGMDDEGAFKGRRRVAELRYLSLCFFGFAFIRAWDDVAFFRFAQLFPASALVGKDLFILVMVLAVFLPGVVLARRIAPLYRRRALVNLSVGALTASTAASFAATAVPGAHEALAVAAVVAGGVGAALSILLWAELQSCFDPFHMVLYVSGSFFLGSVLGWLCIGLDPVRSAAVLLLLPLLSLACMKAGFRKIPVIDLPKRSWSTVRFPWGLIVVLGIYQFVFGLRGGSASFEGGMLIGGTMAVSAALFAAVYFLSHRFDFTALFRTPFVLVTCGLLMELLAFSVGSAVAGFCISAGYALMFLVLTILLCDLSHRYGTSVLVLCGVQELTTLSIVGGHATAEAMNEGLLPVSLNDPLVTGVLAILVVLATVALLSGERRSREWGATFFGLHEKPHDDSLAERCDEVGRKRGLSPREREVLQLLAAGKGSAYIERELCIANGTLKSHTRRIYQKLDVHSREELLAMVAPVEEGGGEPPSCA